MKPFRVVLEVPVKAESTSHASDLARRMRDALGKWGYAATVTIEEADDDGRD